MPETFDPYHRWLGIPPEKQPPNHYVLLAIEPFEASSDVIANAADQRMAHLRTFQTGKRAKVSQKLLNEVSAARVCLLDPEKKAAYDLQLGLKLEDEAARQEAARVAELQRAVPLKDVPVPVSPPPPVTSATAPGVQGEPPAGPVAAWLAGNQVKIFGAAGACVVLLVILVAWPFSPPAETTLAVNWPDEQRDGATLEIDGWPIALATGPIEQVVEPGEHRLVATRPGCEPFEWTGAVEAGSRQSVEPIWKPLPTPDSIAKADDDRPPPVAPSSDPAEPLVEPPVAPPAAVEAPAVADIAEAGANDPATEPPVVAENPPVPEPPSVEPPRPAPGKPPIPSTEAQAAVLEQLEEVYELAKAKNGEEKVRLANELFDLGRKASNPDERFVLLRKAMELSQEGGDAELMFKAIDAIAAGYDVDPWQVKQNMLSKFAGRAKESQEIGSLVKASNRFIDQAMAAERYELALGTATLVYRACQQSAGRDYRKQTYDRRKQIEQFCQQRKELTAALAAVEANPDDGPANLYLGRLYCFDQGDWQRGLPHLAKCSDASLKSAAEQELAASTDPETLLGVADTWYAVAESADDDTKAALLLHAGTWYLRAQPKLKSVLAKAKVNKRLEDIRKVGEPPVYVAGRTPTAKPPEDVDDGPRTLRPDGPDPQVPPMPPRREGLADLLDAPLGAPVTRPTQVRSFDPATVELLRTFPPDSERAGSLAFTPGGKTLMAAYKKHGVKFFDPHTGRLRQALAPPKGEIRRAALSPDGSLLAVATSEKIIGLWNLTNGRFLGQFVGHTDQIRRVVFSPDGSLLASCSNDGTVRLWDTKAVRPLKTLQGHNEFVRGLDFSPDGSVLASMGERGNLFLWDLPSGKQRRSLPLDGKRCAVSLAFSPDGASLTTGHDTFVMLWDLASGTPRRTKGGHSTGTGVAFHPSGSVVGSNSREVQFWDATTGEMLRKIDTSGSMVNSIAFSPDGSMFAFSGEGVPLQIWGHKSGGSASVVPAPSRTQPATAPSQASDSEAEFTVKSSAPASGRTQVKRFDPATAKSLRVFPPESERAVSLAFTPDGKTLLAAYKKHGVQAVNPHGGQPRQLIPPPKGEIRRAALSRDGSLLAVATSEKTIGLWNIATGRFLGQLVGHTGGIKRVAFSPDGSMWASSAKMKPSGSGTRRPWGH